MVQGERGLDPVEPRQAYLPDALAQAATAANLAQTDIVIRFNGETFRVGPGDQVANVTRFVMMYPTERGGTIIHEQTSARDRRAGTEDARRLLGEGRERQRRMERSR